MIGRATERAVRGATAGAAGVCSIVEDVQALRSDRRPNRVRRQRRSPQTLVTKSVRRSLVWMFTASLVMTLVRAIGRSRSRAGDAVR